MNNEAMAFICDTKDCVHWKNGACKSATTTIQEQCCINYERKSHIPSINISIQYQPIASAVKVTVLQSVQRYSYLWALFYI